MLCGKEGCDIASVVDCSTESLPLIEVCEACFSDPKNRDKFFPE
jgi:hypothetical protein